MKNERDDVSPQIEADALRSDMPERHSIPMSLLLSFIGLLAAGVSTWLVLWTGIEFTEYAFGTSHPERRREVETLMNWTGAILAIASSVFIFRVCRRSNSPTVVFHLSYFVGLGLLCYALWVTLTNLNHPISWGEYGSTHVSSQFISVLLICLWLIPVSLMLLIFAVGYDRNSYQHPSRSRAPCPTKPSLPTVRQQSSLPDRDTRPS